MLDTRIFEHTGSSGRGVSEKRRIKINYVGTGNSSQLSYDGFGHLVKIVEAGTVSSTKQFVCLGEDMYEATDATGAVLSQYFRFGQTSSSASYVYQLNKRGDVVGATDSSGNQVASIAYDPYGRPTILEGTFTPDFSFTGLYNHSRSGLNFATYRAYSPSLGRWMNRDPIEERGGVNLYDYVLNDPINFHDPNGTSIAVSLTGSGAPSSPLGPTSAQPSPMQPQPQPINGVCQDGKGIPGGGGTPNDLHNKCKKWCYDTYIEFGWSVVAWCIWTYCRKYL